MSDVGGESGGRIMSCIDLSLSPSSYSVKREEDMMMIKKKKKRVDAISKIENYNIQQRTVQGILQNIMYQKTTPLTILDTCTYIQLSNVRNTDIHIGRMAHAQCC